ncbi:MAG TPA: primary-amine oxidase [Acidimicrobiales bacterium]|nr:primary-amine oxidase [Acidimicrobiales bacterium]
MADAVSSTATEHPLAPLTAAEIDAAVALVRGHAGFGDTARFAYVGLAPPTKDEVRSWSPAQPVDRRVRLMVVTGPEANVVEVVAALATGSLSVTEVPGVRPALLFEESFAAIVALHGHPDWQAAMRRRGIEDMSTVQIDPWPAGSFGVAHEEGRRICRCLAYVRETPDDNGYAHPVEGVIGFVDMARGEVLEVVDTGVVPIPAESGSYYPESVGPLRADLKPIEITQPEGPSFTVEGDLVRWQKWSLRVSMDAVEGLVLHQVGYEDDGRVRSILFRASVSEMVVPYGDPGPMHGWKNAFDAGEWGLGRMVNSLTLGCDCLGVIHYFDAVFATERGTPYVVKNAVCMHEEDYGILWKHNDPRSGRTEVRRSRRLVVSSIATVGNYDYGFFWYFYLDGTIQFEVKLTGILSTMAVVPGAHPPFASMVAPQLAAPYHQHLFNVRLDVDVDGATNSVYEVDSRPVPPGPENPWANAFAPVATLLATEAAAQRVVEPAASRYWKIVNPQSENRLGIPVAYKLLPGPTPTLLADAGSSVARRAGFATRNLWVTPYAPDERRAAGDYPNQHAGGDGLPKWTTQDRPVTERDIVVWYSFGVTHVPRPEDWPVMPVEYAGFHLVPVGFFDRNPALDVPPPPAACHTP